MTGTAARPGVLVLRALGIGDLATAVPALRGLRAAYPDRELALAAPAWLAPLVGLVGGIDRLVPVSDLTPQRWPEQVHRPYRAVNLHGRGPRSHRLLAGAAAEALQAFACPAAGHRHGPPWFSQEHEVARWCRMVRWYGIAAHPADLDLTRPAPTGVPRAATVVHPGAKAAQRRWPAGRFAAVARTLAAAGHRVVVTGGPGDAARVAEVRRRAGLPPAAGRYAGTGLAALADLVAHARLVISGDTGVAHLATAYRVPSVTLFGPVSPRRWGPPPGRPYHRALWRQDLAHRAGAAGGAHPALSGIAVDDVLAAVAELPATG